MKKNLIMIILLLMVFLVNSALSEEEIVFQNTVWLSNEIDTFQGLVHSNLIIEDNEKWDIIKSVEGVFLTKDEDLNARWIKNNKYEDVIISYEMSDMFTKKIAGYFVDDIILTFGKDGLEKKLINIELRLHNSDYNSLKEKIDKQYGNSVSVETEEGIWTDIWYGANNSCILLYTESEGLDFQFFYGRLDASDILDECLKVLNDEVDSFDNNDL